jgi:hypothetical protein
MRLGIVEESRNDFEKGRYHILRTDEDVGEFFEGLENE